MLNTNTKTDWMQSATCIIIKETGAKEPLLFTTAEPITCSKSTGMFTFSAKYDIIPAIKMKIVGIAKLVATIFGADSVSLTSSSKIGRAAWRPKKRTRLQIDHNVPITVCKFGLIIGRLCDDFACKFPSSAASSRPANAPIEVQKQAKYQYFFGDLSNVSGNIEILSIDITSRNWFDFEVEIMRNCWWKAAWMINVASFSAHIHTIMIYRVNMAVHVVLKLNRLVSNKLP